jgi:hypothetical protein
MWPPLGMQWQIFLNPKPWTLTRCLQCLDSKGMAWCLGFKFIAFLGILFAKALNIPYIK